MDEEKQIAEMAKCIYGGRALGKSPTEVARVLYKVGYCKQSEVVREIFEKIKTMSKKFTEKSQDFEFGYRIAIQEILAELKKKYPEELENDR